MKDVKREIFWKVWETELKDYKEDVLQVQTLHEKLSLMLKENIMLSCKRNGKGGGCILVSAYPSVCLFPNCGHDFVHAYSKELVHGFF